MKKANRDPSTNFSNTDFSRKMQQSSMYFFIFILENNLVLMEVDCNKE